MTGSSSDSIGQILIRRDSGGLEGVLILANPGVAFLNLTSEDRAIYLLTWTHSPVTTLAA